MEKVLLSVEKIVIPTYPEPAAEDMPMFAENRVHQRSSGRPYPNKVVLEVDRSHKEDREYTLVRLENKYVRIEILPEIGGRIYSALDKTTGYDFFYKQHVIKPALIGVLGSWISGGVEFNWPFHHRASGFMPCDFYTEELPDGSAVCWLSEHDPIDRMKGMVGIVLKPECSYFETRMRLYNRTEVPHSFLWWENAAVPVNEQYRIFFPQDVSYVNFHYLKSRTTYPIAGNTVFNGIPMEEDRDISWHKNTRQATSYFASASDYDFFGGYDYGKECGVVHIGDHHISPGKKMFTWAYCQLSKSWENALTDTDGEYAELMAGSYSDNQPNFSWLAPYETKQFSQYWYPISKIGSPIFANLRCAINLERDEKGATLTVQTTETFTDAEVHILEGDKLIFSQTGTLTPDAAESFAVGDIPQYVTIEILCGGKTIANYTEQVYDKYNMPEPITDTPRPEQISSVQELYLAGVHVDQYRDPAILPDAYWREALNRDPEHIPSLISMARYEYTNLNYTEALRYINKAFALISKYNARPISGEVYYVKGLILEAMGEYRKAHDCYSKAAWAADLAGISMTRAAVLDLRLGDTEKAVLHAETALDYGRNNSLATAVLAIAERGLGNGSKADEILARQLENDPLDHMARFLAGAENLYEIMDSSAAQTCLDLTFDLAAMGRNKEIVSLLEGLIENRPDQAVKMVYYTLGYFSGDKAYYEKAKTTEMGSTFPFRKEEKYILSDVLNCGNDKEASILLGDLLYNKLHYAEAAELWEKAENSAYAYRNLAVAYFSHLQRENEALPLMKKALLLRPDDSQLLYETVILMNKSSVEPEEKIKLITSKNVTRDDILTELAKAYNQAFMPDKALEVLMSHDFVPCEGGEHAIADQYMFAYLMRGVTAMKAGNFEGAIEEFEKGQTLPQSLGAGIWNHCKLIPLKFHQALCFKAVGKVKAAEEIFRYISSTKIEYFSNMHLKELPFYQARSFEEMGLPTKAQNLITSYYRQWDEIAEGTDAGYFGTTPFFISFMDDTGRLRRAQHLYLTGLCKNIMGDKAESIKRLDESSKLNSDNLFALAAAKGYLF